MSDHIIVERVDRVVSITISRVEKKNAITQEMYGAMADAINAYGSDANARALLLAARGDMFTSGNDLADFASSIKSDEEPGVSRFLKSIKDCPKPLIAAVNGGAIGVGLTMLLHFDLVYASEEATFSAPFVGLGLVPEAASSKLLPDAVGKPIANDIFFTGRSLSAAEALDFGLIARIFSNEELAQKISKIAVQVAASAPSSLRKSKALVRYDQKVVTKQMELENVHFVAQLDSAEFKESVTAKIQKRAPVFD